MDLRGILGAASAYVRQGLDRFRYSAKAGVFLGEPKGNHLRGRACQKRKETGSQNCCCEVIRPEANIQSEDRGLGRPLQI